MNDKLQKRMDKIVAKWEKEQGVQVICGMVMYQRHWLNWLAWGLIHKN